jgi:hypothetical protein
MNPAKDKPNPNLLQSSQEWRLLAHKEGERIEIENLGELDEFVVEHWFHLEELDKNKWWLRIGDARVLIRVGAEGAEVEIERDYYQQEQRRE